MEMEPDCQACSPPPEDLWPRNQRAWEAYLLVHDQVRLAMKGAPPLDLAAAAQVLDKAGLAGDDLPDLLSKLRTIHQTLIDKRS